MPASHTATLHAYSTCSSLCVLFRPLLARSSCASLSVRALYHSTLHAFSIYSSPCVFFLLYSCTHTRLSPCFACFTPLGVARNFPISQLLHAFTTFHVHAYMIPPLPYMLYISRYAHILYIILYRWI